ncbi:hypothetical protein EDF83_1164 [Pseudomonas protegens]|jgi:hypothetical protein|uniref:hypothetical protein n=1 Tax=Pseudomonas TaxID=286 RepID=UPI00098D3AB5|nr:MULTISPECIES: hypothetical protein [Pseudomonas]GED79205.1 hypothetical protein PFL02_60550 [Pseudomonas fluorescens]AQT08533.1 lipoprotein [Pseudomonas protegens]MCS4260536.1 hypothetical protein [Pseudomonas sp. BIGb0176]MDF4208118.1 hypothetical protein [Pseudomonas protegens]ROQ61896.1 hypothetical protein EDF83_1164 [Pseudomonas protegens]
MSSSRALKYLCLGFFLLSGCRAQTLYLNGEARGRVVDALSGMPIAGAKGALCGAQFLTADDGSFKVEAATDWEWVMLLAGRSPQDIPHPCFMSIAAADYQSRQWLAPFTAHYDFPIRLLPISSPLHYALESPGNESVPMQPLQAEPRQDELFLGAGG